MSFKRKILSIDGGGIRGIIPATVLDYIEQKKGKPIAQIFDLIAGTSTGGILSLTLTKPGADGLPQFTAKDIIALYRNRGSEIFHERFPGPFDDLIQAKYGSENREKVLSDYFGNTLLSAALTDVFITSYDIELRIPVFFVSKPQAEVNDQYYEKICGNYTMLQAAMATSATPTFFPPYQIPFIDIVFDAQSEAVACQLDQLMIHVLSQKHYFRYQEYLTEANDDMDDASPQNIQELEKLAAKLIEKNQDDLDQFCDLL